MLSLWNSQRLPFNLSCEISIDGTGNQMVQTVNRQPLLVALNGFILLDLSISINIWLEVAYA
jgi:hypothetical protein